MATITAVNGGGNWSATGTWVGGVVPDYAVDTVVIPATLTAAVVLDDSRTIPATTIEDEVYGLVQGSGVTTTLYGILTVGNGSAKDGKFTFGAGSTLALGAHNLVVNNGALASNATTSAWASVTGSGSIAKGSVHASPKQRFNLTYVSFQNTGSLTFTPHNVSGVLTPIVEFEHCTFTDQTSISFGNTSTTAATNIVCNDSDFRNFTGSLTLSGIAQTTGKREFKNNTLASSLLQVGFRIILSSYDLTGTVFDRVDMTSAGASTGTLSADSVFWGTANADDDVENKGF